MKTKQEQRKAPVLKCQKMAPQTLDQSEGDKVCGPDQNDKTNYGKGMVGLMEKTSSHQVSAQIKIQVMQGTVATCPKVNMVCLEKEDSFTAWTLAVK